MKKTSYAKSGPQRKARGGTLLGIFIGLVLGLLIAFGVVWYLNKTPLPFQEKVTRPERKEANGPPVALPGKPGDKVSEKPRFEFYKILPGQEPAPAPQTAAPSAAPVAAAAQKPAAAPAGEKSYLQAGAFQKATDADNLKAKLAMMGFEAGVQEVDTPDKGKMLRVRLGPFASAEEMNRARNQLSQNGIQATVVRIKE
jgi:cell division protein FtsN